MITPAMVQPRDLILASIFLILKSVTADQSPCASETYSRKCTTLSKSSFVMLSDHPCKIVEVHTTKISRKGKVNVWITGEDIFTGEKFTTLCTVPNTIDSIHVRYEAYALKCISEDGHLTLEDQFEGLRKDLKLPDGELGRQIQESFKDKKDLMLTVRKACGIRTVISYRINSFVDGMSSRISGKRRLCSSLNKVKTPTVSLARNNNTV